jgi:hypothetical protein
MSFLTERRRIPAKGQAKEIAAQRLEDGRQRGIRSLFRPRRNRIRLKLPSFPIKSDRRQMSPHFSNEGFHLG